MARYRSLTPGYHACTPPACERPSPKGWQDNSPGWSAATPGECGSIFKCTPEECEENLDNWTWFELDRFGTLFVHAFPFCRPRMIFFSFDRDRNRLTAIVLRVECISFAISAKAVVEPHPNISS